MIDVSLEFNEFFTMCSCGIITGLVMFFSFYIVLGIFRVFQIITQL